MLNGLTERTYFPLGFSQKVQMKFDGQTLTASTADASLKMAVHLMENAEGPEVVLRSIEDKTHGQRECLESVAGEYLLGHYANVKTLTTDQKSLSRAEFYQKNKLWVDSDRAVGPEKWVMTGERFHPRRPLPKAGPAYQRYIPGIDKTLSFRLIDIEKDLETFHQWHNQERVLKFWELNKSRAELKDYLVKGLADPHQVPMILELDGESVGYFEMYWVAEDRLAPYYECEGFDRGFHFLIGNEKFLGFDNTDAALRSVVHYLFLDEPRTRKIMAEPRSDNQKVLRYVETVPGWRKVKEFDFPHKRAALLECRREKFFFQGGL